MKKITALIIFLCCHALLIFFEVHKQGQYLQVSYDIQKLQTQVTELLKQKNNATYTLHSLQQPTIIADIASKELGMKKIELKQIQIAEEV